MLLRSNRSMRRTALGLLALAAASGVVSAQGGERRYSELEGVEIEQHLEAQLPLTAQFQDQSGSVIALEDCFGDLPVILTLNYVDCPQLCNLQLSQLTETMAAVDLDLGVDYRVVTVSIEPEDTPERLAQMRDRYVDEYLFISDKSGTARDVVAAKTGWICLRGPREEIDRVAETVGFGYAEVMKDGQVEYAHQATNILCSPSGVVSRYLPGVSVDMSNTLRLSLIDAGEGKIGSLFENAFLYCFIYDSTRGQYSLHAWRLLRAAAALTVLAVATGIFFMKRGEAQRTPEVGETAASANEGEQHS